MFKKLYIKMALYFCGVITVTLAAVTVLFFITMGRPLMRDIHSMLRSHTRYIGALLADLTEKGETPAHISGALELFSTNFGFGVAVFNPHGKLLLRTRNLKDASTVLRDDMLAQAKERGLFVQSGHFNRPVIYVFPKRASAGETFYVLLTKHFPENTSVYPLITGLAALCLVLFAAVYPLSRSITRPMSELSVSLKKMAGGVFDDIPRRRGRSDEIGEVLSEFRRMSLSVSFMIESRKQLLADISHELCSPLARIRVGTELIKDAGSDEKTLRHVRNIEKDIESMDRLIMNLSSYSRLNLPGFTLLRKKFDPSCLVDLIVTLYRPLAEKKALSVSPSIPGGGHAVEGDYERLKQVFSNLMDNALRHSDPGTDIGLGFLSNSSGISFFVENEGPGVPDLLREKIFEPLFRVDTSRNQDSGGAGLGLAISQKIVELHGGRITCLQEGKKTRFIFHLPKELTHERTL